MSSDFVWHAVEIAEEDACPDCGGHPELCGCDGADPLEATSEPAPLAEIDSEAKQPVSMLDEETKRDRPKRACHYATASGPRAEAQVLTELDTAMANLASMCGWRPAVTPL